MRSEGEPLTSILVPDPTWPILICLLGVFRLFKNGQLVPVRTGGKTEELLRALALRPHHVLSREEILSLLWPQSLERLAGQALHSLIYGVHRMFGDCIGGAAPIVRAGVGYRLNIERGIGIDVMLFDQLAESGAQEVRAGRREAAVELFRRAVALYYGDLSAGLDVHSTIERERLRATYLTLLAHLADHHYSICDHASCLHYALRLLSHEPCREDAHRIVMQCYVRKGQRAQAMRQYRVCEKILRAEFDVAPEAETQILFRQICLDPNPVKT